MPTPVISEDDRAKYKVLFASRTPVINRKDFIKEFNDFLMEKGVPQMVAYGMVKAVANEFISVSRESRAKKLIEYVKTFKEVGNSEQDCTAQTVYSSYRNKQKSHGDY